MNKPKKNQAENPEVVDGRDTFQTPNYAVNLLVPLIPRDVHRIWECAVGQWKLADRLIHHGYDVSGSDIRVMDNRTELYNFILEEPQIILGSGMIITNPPFSLKRKFYERCLLYKVPFALLIPADYSGWIIKATQDGAEKIIPTRRIDYITPTGLSGATGHTSYYHSMWLTYGFGLGKSETFVELTNDEKRNNI
jgi:hypothetical protein